MSAGQVAILLSTRNGALFLQEQLESILAQSVASWVIYWRDDGSSDGTPDLMRSFARQAGRDRCIELGARDGADVGHVGIAASFLALLRAAPAGSVVAFADQDDVWLPDKLERGLAALSASDPDRPALYCARQRLVDDRLRTLGLSPHRGPPPAFPAGLTQNVATGCTVMLNPRAAALVAGARAPDGTLHDWWSYLVVGAAGGILIADPVPTVLYRQHRRNAVGAPHSALRRGLMALGRGPDAFMMLFKRHVAALLANPQALSAQAADDLALLQRALERGILARLRAIAQVRSLVRQTWLETLLFRLWFLIG
jgi:hypothetical protein